MKIRKDKEIEEVEGIGQGICHPTMNLITLNQGIREEEMTLT